MITDVFDLKKAIRPISITDLWKGYKERGMVIILIFLLLLSPIEFFLIHFKAPYIALFIGWIFVGVVAFLWIIPFFTMVILTGVFNIIATVSFLILSFIDFSIEGLNSINFLK
jgi:hypothetical protein